jgi:hypothetical protein
MARPLLVPTAFATALLAASPAFADESAPAPEPTVAVVAPLVAPAVLASLAPSLPADPLTVMIPVATRAAGNARLPLYDDGAMMTKGACRNCR